VITPESPELLDARADDLETEALAMTLRPDALRFQAAGLRSLAAAIRNRDTALAALTAAEAEYGRLAGVAARHDDAEADAARRALDARQIAEAAWDTERNANMNIRAEPAELVRLKEHTTAAYAVAEHESGMLAGAQADRQAAREAARAARGKVRAAKEAAAAAEHAVANPDEIEPDPETIAKNMAWSWATRVILDTGTDPQFKMTGPERELAVAYCTIVATLLGIDPATVSARARRQAEAEYRRAMPVISGPGGWQYPLAAVHGASGGQ
jgi:hypothetical protein